MTETVAFGKREVSLPLHFIYLFHTLLNRSLVAVSSDKHPRVAMVLMLLGKVYARTARVMFAEGLYRECLKLMQLDDTKVGGPCPHVHPSVAAMLGWQYHQLLKVLPNRGMESDSRLSHSVFKASSRPDEQPYVCLLC